MNSIRRGSRNAFQGRRNVVNRRRKCSKGFLVVKREMWKDWPVFVYAHASVQVVTCPWVRASVCVCVWMKEWLAHSALLFLDSASFLGWWSRLYWVVEWPRLDYTPFFRVVWWMKVFLDCQVHTRWVRKKKNMCFYSSLSLFPSLFTKNPEKNKCFVTHLQTDNVGGTIDGSCKHDRSLT